MPAPRYRSPDFVTADFKEGDFANRFGYSFAEDEGPATVGITETTHAIVTKIVVADLDIVGVTETGAHDTETAQIQAAIPDTVTITESTFVVIQTVEGQPFNPALFGGPPSTADRPHVRYTTPKKTKAQLKLEKEVERALKEEPKKEPIIISKRLRSRYNIESAEIFERNKAIKELIDKAIANPPTRSLELFQASFSPKPITAAGVVAKKPIKYKQKTDTIAVTPTKLQPISNIEQDMNMKTPKHQQQQQYMRSLSSIEADQKTTIPKLSPIEEVKAGIKSASLNKTIRQITQMKEVLSLLLTIDAI